MLSCQMTLMFVFIGGGAGSDAMALLVIQACVAPVALLIFAWQVLRRVMVNGWGNSFRAMWHALPAWLVLALVVLNSLVLIGELSLFLRERLMERSPLWVEHAPLLCVLACSLAFVALFDKSSIARDRSRAPVGRW